MEESDIMVAELMSPLQSGQPPAPNAAPAPAAAPMQRTGPAAPPIQQQIPSAPPLPGTSAAQGTAARTQSNGIDRVEISQQAVNAMPKNAPGAPSVSIFNLDNMENPATAPVQPNVGGSPSAAPNNNSGVPGMLYPPAGGPPPPPQDYQSSGQFLDLTA